MSDSIDPFEIMLETHKVGGVGFATTLLLMAVKSAIEKWQEDSEYRLTFRQWALVLMTLRNRPKDFKVIYNIKSFLEAHPWTFKFIPLSKVGVETGFLDEHSMSEINADYMNIKIYLSKDVADLHALTAACRDVLNWEGGLTGFLKSKLN